MEAKVAGAAPPEAADLLPKGPQPAAEKKLNSNNEKGSKKRSKHPKGKHGGSAKRKSRSRSKKKTKRTGFCCAKKKKSRSRKHKKKVNKKQPHAHGKPPPLAPALDEKLGDVVLVKNITTGMDAKPDAPQFPRSMEKVEDLDDNNKDKEKEKEKEKDKDKENNKDKKFSERKAPIKLSKETVKASKEVIKVPKDDDNTGKMVKKTTGQSADLIPNFSKERMKEKEKDKSDAEKRSPDRKDEKPAKITTESTNEEFKDSNARSSKADEEKKEKWMKLAKKIADEGASTPEKEFSTMGDYIPAYVSKEAFSENMEKNRFSDVVCLDHSRVTLADGTYIHASWLEIEDNHNMILTQFPLPHTAVDFWQMIIEQRVKAICLIMTDDEYSTLGGDFVFPQNRDFLHFSEKSIRVGEFNEIEVNKGWTLRVLSISNGAYKSFLHLHQFKCWPHNEIPKSTKSVWQLQSALRKYPKPIVIMSLSGCGRAGTLATLEYAHASLHSRASHFSLEDCLKKVRTCRLHSVQNVTQYSFIYSLLAEHVLGNV
ncbi:unnamed protein product [Caenorhabditis bovis]|uniref:Tyrosine-protein phosphatase domain-containing protein n=1 Tax=Caenorhabditis bovis TaxID=2654633 RepID=A0A8S1FD93_9PELO|nr:unnamed protein product [Caenorhabditis bovis]